MDIKIAHFKPYAQNYENWVAILDNNIVGHIYMGLEPNNKLKFYDAWVHQDHRRKGIYRLLWDTRWEYVQANYKGYVTYAWCLPMSLPLLIEKGFKQSDNCVYVEREVG